MDVSVDASWSHAVPTTQSPDEIVEVLAQEHARFVFRVAYSVLRNHHDAEDAVQETFLRAVRRRSELSGIREPRAWLARIAFRIAINRYRSRRTETDDPTAILLALQAKGAATDELVHSSEMKVLLERMIASLPVDLRDVLRLSTVTEMTSIEIAKVLEIPESSVRTRLLRARRLLKEKLDAALRVNHG